MSFLLSCKPLRTIPQQFVAPEENNLISRSYCHKRSADYKNLIVRLVTMVPSHNNCNVSSFLSPSPTPTYQAAEKNRFTAKIELLSSTNWKHGTCTGAAGIIRAMLVFVLNPPPTLFVFCFFCLLSFVSHQLQRWDLHGGGKLC